MKYYVNIKHPITGATIQGVPTGKRSGQTIEVLIITPRSNLTTLWITEQDCCRELSKEEHLIHPDLLPF